MSTIKYFYSGPGYTFIVADQAMGEKIVDAICASEPNIDEDEFTANILGDIDEI